MNVKLYKQSILIVLTCILSCVLFTGCFSSNKAATSSQVVTNDNINYEITSLKKKNALLEKKIDTLTQQTQNLDKTLAEQVSIVTLLLNQQAESKEIDNIFPVFSANVDSYEKEINYYVNIPKDLTLKEKLQVLADKLSKVQFGDLPITVLKIENIDGKKVATINLREAEVNRNKKDYADFNGAGWANHYFQGSTGGICTSVTLIETFLQKEYKGEWIDGVKFLYENKDCDFEHVADLANTNFR